MRHDWVNGRGELIVLPRRIMRDMGQAGK